MAKKQPKLVLRESSVMDMSRTWPKGRFFEAGAGTGHMTALFLDRGFTGACHDLGEDNRARLRANLAGYGSAISVVDSPDDLPGASFDYLTAFEVLEHIEPDREVLASWARLVRPGGRLLVSVPAHMSAFGRSDELVGHVRRYEKAELRDLIESAGFTDVRIINYGFPITELTRRISNRMVKSDASYDGMDDEQRSIRSAQQKPRAVEALLKVVGGNAVLPFAWIQRAFYSLDWGDGYVATGVRR